VGDAHGAGRELVPIGVVVGAHGVQGELRVKLYNPASEALDRIRDVVLRDNAGVNALVRIRARRRHQELFLLTLETCGDRDAAIALRGHEVCVPRTALPKLPAGEHYLIDLIGLRAQRPTGEEVGVVESVIPYPTVDALCVRSAHGIVEVPMLAPYFVEARVAEGFIVIDFIEDLAT
jgi:16S rRNA processing protein RimM